MRALTDQNVSQLFVQDAQNVTGREMRSSYILSLYLVNNLRAKKPLSVGMCFSEVRGAQERSVRIACEKANAVSPETSKLAEESLKLEHTAVPAADSMEVTHGRHSYLFAVSKTRPLIAMQTRSCSLGGCCTPANCSWAGCPRVKKPTFQRSFPPW